MKNDLSFRVLSADELERFVAFVRDHYSREHSYVLYPEMARHFYADGDRLNVYAAYQGDELIGVWPFLYYNEGKTDAAGCLFLFKPLDNIPFVGQSFMKKFLEDLAPEGFYTAGILERLIPFYQRVKHKCGRFSQYYWRPSMETQASGAEPSGADISSIRVCSGQADFSELEASFPSPGFLPRKDFWFLKKSYLDNRAQPFEVFRGSLDGKVFAFVTATFSTPMGRILRLYDFFGDLKSFPLVLTYLKHKAWQEDCVHTDVMVAGLEDSVFAKAGFLLLDPEQGETIIPNNFFPFQPVNSKVFFGVRQNNPDIADMPVVLFKGTGDQIVPRQIDGWD